MSQSRSSPLLIGLMGACIASTVVVAVMMMRWDPTAPSASPARAKTASHVADSPGVRATITAGSRTIERTFPSLNFAIGSGESLDARLEPGQFTARFELTFQPGAVRQATVGAEIQGGQLIIHRGDRPPLLADAAGAESALVMTTMPESFGRGLQRLVYEFKSRGDQPCRMRAMWKPLESQVPLPLPSAGSPLLTHELRGEALVQQFGCANCHAAGTPILQKRLAFDGPILGDVGKRVRPQWLRQWLADPVGLSPTTSMPDLFHECVANADAIEDLTHFLTSMGGPMDESNAQPLADLAATGMIAYHTVGCFACHGALEPLDSLPGQRPSIAEPYRHYAALSDMSFKTAPRELSQFLADPLRWRPSGRMPAMNLTPVEAESIAHYLIAREAKSQPTASEPFTIDTARVERGRAHFSKLGCANCHSLGPDRPATEPSVRSRALEELAVPARAGRGCVGEAPTSTVPMFALSSTQRQAIVAFLESLRDRRCEQVPLDQLAVAMTRLNCTACHEYLASRGPETAISQYFSAIEEADLGDEGRVPPNLSDVGARLNGGWMHQVLAGKVQTRPYMGMRMPVFGEANVENLPRQFGAAAGVIDLEDRGPESTSTLTAAGRDLVGSKGMNCIQCHNVAGRPSTGTPGPDLASVVERLRYDAFSRWLHDPAQMRPGTRMPSFFVLGRSGFTQHFEGEADQQIKAVWAYLSQGEFMPLPEGLTDPTGLALNPVNEPIVFRSFMKLAGTRAIACGFPERVHCAFDAETCRLALVWTGEFINATGAWAARGGTPTNPEQVQWIAEDAPILALIPDEATSAEFRGYELDNQRRPIFLYQLRQGKAIVDVREQPQPVQISGKASLRRTFTLKGEPGQRVLVRVSPDQILNCTSPVEPVEAGTRLVIGPSGSLTFELEVTW